MNALVTRDVEYWHAGTRMLGHACAPPPEPGSPHSPGVLLIHDAFGVSDHMIRTAYRLAELGHPVFVADVWGQRRVPSADAEIGPLIGGMVGDRDRWLGRLRAAHSALAEQPEFDGRSVVLLGYCFGGSSALEYLRTGTGTVAGVIAIHPGLDLVDDDWTSPASAPVLICTGVDDPMATAEMRARLETAMSAGRLDWQVHLYSDTAHAFSSPHAIDSAMPGVAYNPRSAARSWQATLRFLGDVAAMSPAH